MPRITNQRSSCSLSHLSLAAAGLLLSAGGALSAELTRSVDVAASPAEVWAVVGPFCSIAEWYPGLASCAEEEINGKRHRRLQVQDGPVFLEMLVDHSDHQMAYTYTIEEGPLPVAEYRATVEVEEADSGATITWSGTFKPKGASEEEAVGVVAGIYEDGLAALEERFTK